MRENNIDHRKITPLWPQANSEAENFMKPLTKAIRLANSEGKNWKKHLYLFLLNYRATPHCTTGFSPAELLYNRKVQTKLPQLATKNRSDVGHQVQQNDERAKMKIKEYADKKSKAEVSNLQIGDLVLIRQRKQNKLSTKFNSSPFRVVRKKETMVTAVRRGKYVTRNVSQFKRVDSSTEAETSGEEEEEDEDLTNDFELQGNADANANPAPNVNAPRRYPTRNRTSCRRYSLAAPTLYPSLWGFAVKGLVTLASTTCAWHNDITYFF